MRKTLLTLSAVIVTAALTTETARAQARRFGRPPTRRPVTSPYLNLLRGAGGGGIGFNYYRRIRPEQEFRRADSNFNRSLDSLQNRVQNQQQEEERRPLSGLNQTGHPVRFLDLGGYFPLNQRR